MALRNTFLTVEPREKAGARSADRSDYQKHWALCRLLELHAAGADYLIIFDLHDDVLVFDSEANPNWIDFFQIKTKTPRTWSIRDLLYRRKGKDGPLLSILGKLCSNKVSFPDNTRALTFVSNAPMNIPLADGSSSEARTSFSFRELAPQVQTTILAQVEAECGMQPAMDAPMTFEVSDLSIQDHAVHAKGKLAEFIQALQPDRAVRINVIYRTLKDEITRRNNYDKELLDFSDLARKKGFGRSGFEFLLYQANVYGDPAAAWAEASQRLNAEGFQLGHIRTLKQKWGELEPKRLDAANASLLRLGRNVRIAIGRLSATGTPATLTQLLDGLIGSIRTGKDEELLRVFDDDDIRVVALMEWYEARELPTTSASFTEEEE